MTTSLPPSANTAPRNSRLWFQFSLRTLLIVVSIVAVAMGLLMRYVDQQREIVRQEKEAIAEIEKLGGIVKYDDKSQPVLPSFPSWLRTILGDEEYQPVTGVVLGGTPIIDTNLVHLSKLKVLQELSLQHTSITDAGISQISDIASLKVIYLRDTDITDEGLFYLSKLSSLEYLSLSNTKITDAGLIHLSKLTALKVLYLEKTQITNVGLTHLSKLNALFEVYLFNTPITNAGYKKIKAALPKCQIGWSPPENSNQ